MIRDWIHHQDFHPTLMGAFVNPFYFARGGLARQLSRLGPAVRGRTLDVGCGRKPYEGFFRSSQYVGLEVDSPESRRAGRADVFYDGKRFPFEDASFDSLVATEVLEHVFRPAEFLSEAGRVLKGGGALLLSVPFVWDEHGQPWDFARYTSFGLRYLLEEAGFEVLEVSKTVADVRALFQLVIGYLYKKTVTRSGWFNRLTTLFLMAPLNLAGEALAFFLPGNEDLYLDNVVLARKRGTP